MLECPEYDCHSSVPFFKIKVRTSNQESMELDIVLDQWLPDYYIATHLIGFLSKSTATMFSCEVVTVHGTCCLDLNIYNEVNRSCSLEQILRYADLITPVLRKYVQAMNRIDEEEL